MAVETFSSTRATFALAASDALVKAPTSMPWGNRSLLCHNPDGNLVNLFTPVTAEASDKFAHQPVA